jgi:hypothetical protein
MSVLSHTQAARYRELRRERDALAELAFDTFRRAMSG